MARHRPALGFIFLTLFLDVLGFGLLIPVAPRLVKDVSDTGTEQAAVLVGLLSSLYALMQFVFAPIIGALSDRFGRRPVLLVSVAGSGLDYFAMALAPTLPWLFITRAINGISGGSMTAANAYIADITAPEKRAAAYGMVGAAFGLGFIFGPLAGGLLGSIDIRLPFYVAGGLTCANWLYGLFVLPESLPPERRRPVNMARANPLGALRHITEYPLILGLGAAMFLSNVAQFALHSTWALYTEHRYGWSPTMIGLSLAAVGLGAAFVQAGLAGRVIKRLGEARSLVLAFVIAVLAFSGYAGATHGWMIFAVIVVGSFGGVGMPAAQSMITRTARLDEQGSIQGALMGLQSIAAVLGPQAGSRVFAWSISDEAAAQMPAGVSGALPGLVYFMSAGLSVVGLVVVMVTLKRHKPPPVGTQAGGDGGA